MARALRGRIRGSPYAKRRSVGAGMGRWSGRGWCGWWYAKADADGGFCDVFSMGAAAFEAIGRLQGLVCRVDITQNGFSLRLSKQIVIKPRSLSPFSPMVSNTLVKLP